MGTGTKQDLSAPWSRRRVFAERLWHQALLNVSNGGLGSRLPPVGALEYSTPIPINEDIQATISGQFYVENLATVMVISARGVANRLIVENIDKLGAPLNPSAGSPRSRQVAALLAQWNGAFSIRCSGYLWGDGI